MEDEGDAHMQQSHLTYSNSSKLDFFSSPFGFMSLKNLLQTQQRNTMTFYLIFQIAVQFL